MFLATADAKSLSAPSMVLEGGRSLTAYGARSAPKWVASTKQMSTSAVFMDTQPILTLTPDSVRETRAFDLDRDGVDEVLLFGASKGLYGMSLTVLKYDNSSNRYRLHKQAVFPYWSYPSFTLNLISRDADGAPIAVISSLVTERVDLLTLESKGISFSTALYGRELLHRDLNGDSTAELFYFDGTDIQFVDFESLSLGQRLSFDLPVRGFGQFLGESSEQLLTFSNDNAAENAWSLWRVTNMTPVKLQSGHYPGRADIQAISDINNDGVDELLSVDTTSKSMQAFTPKTQQLRWQRTVNKTPHAIKVGQLDSATNHIYLHHQTGLDVFNEHNGSLRGEIENETATPGTWALVHGVISDRELLFQSINERHFSPILRLIDSQTLNTWAGVRDHGTGVILQHWADLEGDGEKELLTLLQGPNSGDSSRAHLLIHSPTTMNFPRRMVVSPHDPLSKVRVIVATHVWGESGPGYLWLVSLENTALRLSRMELVTGNVEHLGEIDGTEQQVGLHRFAAKGREYLALMANMQLRLFDTTTATEMTRISIPQTSRFQGIAFTDQHHADDTHSLWISSNAPIADNEEPAIVEVRLVGNMLVRFPDPVASGRYMGKITSLKAGNVPQLYGLSDQGYLWRYQTINKTWSIMDQVCVTGYGVLKSLSDAELLIICDGVGGVYNPITGETRWAVLLSEFEPNSAEAVAIHVESGKEVMAVGGANVLLASTDLVSPKPVAFDYQLLNHWAKTVEFQLPVSNPNPNQSLVTEIVLQPTNGALTVVDSAAGIVRYQPGAASLQPVSARYRVRSGVQESGVAEISIIKSNTPPMAQAMTINAVTGVAVQGKLVATDQDADVLQWQVLEQPLKGSLTLNSQDSSFVYTANSGATGTDSFNVVVKDGVSSSTAAKVTVNISNSSGGSSGGGGSMHWLGLMLIVYSWMLRNKAR